MIESKMSNIVSGTPRGIEYWQSAVDKMERMTYLKALKWDVVEAQFATASSLNKVFAAYDARYNDQIVRIVEADPGKNNNMIVSMVDPGRRQFEYSLLLIDENGSPLFTFPSNLKLVELVAAIKAQLANAVDFVEALLAA